MTKRKCKRSSQAARRRLLAGATTFRCYYCEKVKPAAAATLEHIIPLQFDGDHSPANTTLACAYCNSGRNRFVTKVLAGRHPNEAMQGLPKCVLRGIVFMGSECFFRNHLLDGKAGAA